MVSTSAVYLRDCTMVSGHVWQRDVHRDRGSMICATPLPPHAHPFILLELIFNRHAHAPPGRLLPEVIRASPSPSSVGGVPIQVSSLFPSSRSIGSIIKDLQLHYFGRSLILEPIDLEEGKRDDT